MPGERGSAKMPRDGLPPAPGDRERGSADYFEAVAPEWDAMRRGFFTEALREKALDAARVRAGETAADIGAGAGFMTEGLLSRGLAVIAVDRSEAMLRELLVHFSGVPGLAVRQGESGTLPLSDGEVDAAFANMYLHHVPDPAAALREMARTLRPGGRLVVTDLDEHDYGFLRTEHHDRWMGFRRGDVSRWLREAGLRNVAVTSPGES